MKLKTGVSGSTRVFGFLVLGEQLCTFYESIAAIFSVGQMSWSSHGCHIVQVNQASLTRL